MSTCISKHGEFGSHTFSDRGQPLMCQLCFAFDEEAASDRLRAARWLVGDWEANADHRPPGDPVADVWLLAARQLRAALDGRESHDVNPTTPAPTPAHPSEEADRG